VYSDINLRFLSIFKGETIGEGRPEEKRAEQGSLAKKGEARPPSSALLSLISLSGGPSKRGNESKAVSARVTL
jgi:hypothetical protein